LADLLCRLNGSNGQPGSVGHIYHHGYRQAFESRVFSWQDKAASGKLTCKVSLAPGTRIVFSVRSATDNDSLTMRPWTSVTNNTFAPQPIDRRMQYRADFHSDNGDRYPILDRVNITLAP